MNVSFVPKELTPDQTLDRFAAQLGQIGVVYSTGGGHGCVAYLLVLGHVLQY